MMRRDKQLREQAIALGATAVCFLLGAAAGVALLWGTLRPFSGQGSLLVPCALIAGVIAGTAFVVSTLMHRRGETRDMPRWQALVSDVSSVAVTLAMIAVTALGVLLAGQVLGSGLQGLRVSALGGGLLTGVASAVAGRLAFRAGVRLRTADIAALLFGFLIIGTLFAMTTATDPTWWQRNFSQLGAGVGSWAFNGTLLIAGLLIATTGSYVGRDLHRIRGDAALRVIMSVVLAWAGAGVALAAIGMLPINRTPLWHAIAAFSALAVVVVAAILTTRAIPDAPLMLRVVTAALVAGIGLGVVLTFAVGLLSVTALESLAVGLVLLWLSTCVGVLAALTPDVSRPSLRRSPLAASL